MAIKFKHIVSGEIRVAETEPMIAAMINSGNLGPNAREGQDFGWRIAPEVVVQMKRIKQNQPLLMQIAQIYNLPLDEVNDIAILHYISDQTSVEDAPVVQDGDYEDEYLREIQELEQAETPDISSPKKGRQIQ